MGWLTPTDVPVQVKIVFNSGLDGSFLLAIQKIIEFTHFFEILDIEISDFGSSHQSSDVNLLHVCELGGVPVDLLE